MNKYIYIYIIYKKMSIPEKFSELDNWIYTLSTNIGDIIANYEGEIAANEEEKKVLQSQIQNRKNANEEMKHLHAQLVTLVTSEHKERQKCLAAASIIESENKNIWNIGNAAYQERLQCQREFDEFKRQNEAKYINIQKDIQFTLGEIEKCRDEIKRHREAERIRRAPLEPIFRAIDQVYDKLIAEGSREPLPDDIERAIGDEPCKSQIGEKTSIQSSWLKYYPELAPLYNYLANNPLTPQFCEDVKEFKRERRARLDIQEAKEKAEVKPTVDLLKTVIGEARKKLTRAKLLKFLQALTQTFHPDQCGNYEKLDTYLTDFPALRELYDFLKLGNIKKSFCNAVTLELLSMAQRMTEEGRR
jgi:hypothetical protein